MFRCSICSEIFASIFLNPICATQCGHVFHHQCLMTWLERSPSCPHCRSLVLENNVFKLFVQTDLRTQGVFDDQFEEEIKTLKDKLKSIEEKDSRNCSSIKNLETQLNDKKIELGKSYKFIEFLKSRSSNERKDNFKVSSELKLMTSLYNSSELKRKKLEADNLHLDSKTKSLDHELYELQSLNSSYFDKLKLQISNLKSKAEYFQGRCRNMERMNIGQPSTSKMNIKNQNSSSFQNENKIVHYGPDPEMNLSNNRFLSGCVFLFIEVEGQYGHFNICNNTTLYKKKIIQHGGLVELNYSVRITHIICVTQNHHSVEQGIKEGKRCVTGYWLVDILAKERIIPPWLAIHFPIPYSLENMPCQNIKFSTFYFGINERQIIHSMIKLVGGSHETEITSKTDVVVSLKLEEELIEKIWEINKPVVNVQWLNDILFGEKLGSTELGNPKYKEFDLNDPFLVNLDMVSHLMEAWKTTLVSWNSQGMYTLTANSDSSPRNKRQKTISDEPKEIINLDDDDSDDDSDDDDVVITYVKNVPLKPCVMFSGVLTANREMFRMIIYQLGGSVAKKYSEVTHLIMNKPETSIEFFGCISTVQYIVNEDWLFNSYYNSKLEDETNYLIKVVENQSCLLHNVSAILKNNNRHLLFQYLTFFVTRGIKHPPSSCLRKIISSAGGTVERERRSLESIRGLEPNSYFIISCQEDHCLYNDLLHIPGVVYSPEFITCSILEQSVQLHRFLLKTTAQD